MPIFPDVKRKNHLRGASKLRFNYFQFCEIQEDTNGKKKNSENENELKMSVITVSMIGQDTKTRAKKRESIGRRMAVGNEGISIQEKKNTDTRQTDHDPFKQHFLSVY